MNRDGQLKDSDRKRSRKNSGKMDETNNSMQMENKDSEITESVKANENENMDAEVSFSRRRWHGQHGSLCS